MSFDYTLYTYDTNHRLTEEQYIGKDENSVINYIEILSSVYKDGLLKTKLYYKLDIISLDSTYLGKRELFYNNNKVDSALIFGAHGEFLEKWILSYQNDLLKLIEYNYFDSILSDWHLYRIEEYVFDNNNRLIEEDDSQISNSGTINLSKDIYIFDSNKKYKRSDQFIYDSLSMTWQSNFYCDLYEPDITRTTDSTRINDNLNFNEDFIYWNSPDRYKEGTLNFFSTDGKLLYLKKIQANQYYSWPKELFPGVYLANLSINKKEYSKLVIKKN